MLAGPAISGMASGKTAISLLRSASISSPVVSAERPPGTGENQFDRLQQEQDASGNLETGHADLQELYEPRTADCEYKEYPAGDGDALDRKPRPHAAAGSRRKDPEDGYGLERADGDQKHHDCRSGKLNNPPHLIA